MKRRRKIVLGSIACAFGFPVSTFAQEQSRVWRVGFLSLRHIDFVDADPYYGPFRLGLRELGYVEGKNLVIEWRSAEGKSERLNDIASELFKAKVDVIVTAGTAATRAAQKIVTGVPIVMVYVGDPVGVGFVNSLARPGTNITGLSTLSDELGAKHFEMLRSIVPRLIRVGVLVNPANPTHVSIFRSVENAASKFDVKVSRAAARTVHEIEGAFSGFDKGATGAVIVGIDAFFIQQRRQIADLAVKHRLPSISASGEYAEAGGLLGYGQSLAQSYRYAATYVNKILRGAKPSEIPVEQPTKFELVVNMNTAKLLGITIPNSILVGADKIIN